MLIKRQKIILKKVFTITIFAVNILGLWPFKFDNRRVKYCYRKAIYSVAMFCLGMCIYLIIGGYVFDGMKEEQLFGSFTLQLMSFVYVASIITSYVLIYFGQHSNSKNIANAYVKWKDVGEIFSCKTDFSIYLVDFIVKTIVFEFVNSILVLKNIALSSLTIENIVFGVILLLPPITSRLYMNVFYGLSLVLTALFKEVNEALNVIAANVEIADLENIVKNKNKNILMKKYCNLSDEVDNLSTLYFRMTDVTKLINSIFSVNIMLWSAMIILTLTIQFLFQFVIFIELIKEGNEFQHFQNVFGYASILLLAYDYFSTAYACERLVNQASQTAIILHKSKCNRGIDIRLRRSIDIFSTRILLDKLEIKQSGMLTLDLRTVQMVVSTIVSYSVVLLQFELAERERMSLKLEN